MVDTQDTATGSAGFEEGAPRSGTGAGTRQGIDVQGMLSQLQGMISKVAVASEPTLREVAAKAAELAAVAAERAGPLAHTIADKTDVVSHTVAEKASAYAASMRARADAAHEPSAGDTIDPDVVGVTDPAEESPRDGA